MDEVAIKEKYLRGNNAKLKAAKIAAAAMIVTALILSRFLFGASETEHRIWLYDKNDVLKDSTIETINDKNSALYSATDEKAEIVVVVERESGQNRDLFKRAEKLFKDYGVGSGGMLIIVSVPEAAAPAKNIFEEWGRGVGEYFGNLFGGERISYACFMGKNVDHSVSSKKDEIFEAYFSSSYAAEDYNAAVLDTFNAFYGEFEKYHNVSASDLPAYAEKPSLFYPVVSVISKCVLVIVILFAAALLIRAIFGRGKNYGTKRVYKKSSWF